MTEPIIIDGIDVSECSYAILPKKQCPMKSMPYAKETSCTACKENNTRLNFCKNNPNCYFKQLKSKEQECKSLYNKLQKAENNCIKVFNLFSELGEKYTKLKVECEKYKKCIDDIKIINKDLLKGICDNCDWHNTDGCDPEDFVCGELIKIKQKINEVENEKV